MIEIKDVFGEIIISGPQETVKELIESLPKEHDLSGIDLSGIDLSGIDLSYFLLKYADLRNIILANADLRNADLTGANLTFADFTGANLSHANLTDTIGPCKIEFSSRWTCEIEPIL
jgi:uncharacterized protein YjbI with pentapeptide repeats